ncbi:hypothetical protein BGZ94_001299 [Podila epigama]|nr:hypothetical protein BGZ94_001299 [Podila epigama]
MFPVAPPTDDSNLALDGVHKFFIEEDPDHWTPIEFAARSDAISYLDYIKGLHKIKHSGTSSLATYCKDIIHFLQNDPNGKCQVQQAERTIDLRIAMREEKMQELVWKARASTNFMKRQSEEELLQGDGSPGTSRSKFRLSANSRPQRFIRTPSPLKVNSSPERTPSPVPYRQTVDDPASPARTLPTFEDAEQFFQHDQPLQDVILDSLQSGETLPSWARTRPDYQFECVIGDRDYGQKLTDWYNVARKEHALTHANEDQIALLSGVLQVFSSHHDLTEDDMAFIRRHCLATYYSQEQRKQDLKRSQVAATLWSSWVQALESLKIAESHAALDKERPEEPIDTVDILEMIRDAYQTCKESNILPVYYSALTIFRKYNDYDIPHSEMSWTVSMVLPLLEEFLSLQNKLIFKCANSGCQASASRKSSASNRSHPRRPDIIGLGPKDTEADRVTSTPYRRRFEKGIKQEKRLETYYGEIKMGGASPLEWRIDRLRLSIFTKDALDLFQQRWITPPPVLTFQVIGDGVVFFLGVRMDDCTIHLQISSLKLPTKLSDLSLKQEVFFALFQAQTLALEALRLMQDKANCRSGPFVVRTIPTMPTPDRLKAMAHNRPNTTPTSNPMLKEVAQQSLDEQD